MEYDPNIQINIPVVREVEPRLRLHLANEYATENMMTSPESVLSFVRRVLSDRSEEQVYVINLSKNLKVINIGRVSSGSLDLSIATTREIFKTAIMSNSNCIVLCHTHPSGSIEPSANGLSVTRKLIKAGMLVDIPLVDHIIVGAGGLSYSFAVNGRSMFQEMIAEAKKDLHQTKITKIEVECSENLLSGTPST